MKKNNFNKKAISSVIISLFSLIIIGGYYLYASADDDAFSNKLSIRNRSITTIIDGEEPFDADNNAGNDSSNQNNLIRTFDKVTYTVEYELYQKVEPTPEPEPVPDDPDAPDDPDTPDTGNNEPTSGDNQGEPQVGDVTPDARTIVVGVLFPSSVNGVVLGGGQTVNLGQVFNDYKYAEFEVEGNIGQNSFDFSLANIYGSNESKFTPIVLLRESTDEDTKSISGLTDEQRGQSVDTVLSVLGGSSTCDYANGCEVTVSGKEDYFVKLFKGTHEVDGKDTEMALGFMIGIEDKVEKHIKGVLYPTTVEFNLEVSQNNANDILYDGESNRTKIKPYNQNNTDYNIYIDDNHSAEIPDTYSSDSYNGEVSTTFDSEHSKFSISVTNINFNNQVITLGDKTVYYLSTNSLMVKSSRKSYSENTEDIEIDFTAKQGTNVLDTVQDVDKLGRFVGPYESRIYLYDENDKDDASHYKEDGLAIINYGQYFYFDEEIQYSPNNVGSNLKELTNYIKIDNDAIKLVLYDNGENKIIPKGNAINNTTKAVKYYYGKWTTEYVKMKDNAPASCPDISNLSKENLMNLYGGPCIEFKNNVVVSDEYFDNTFEYGPMAVSIKFTPSSENGIMIDSSWSIWHKAKIIDNPEIERSVRQISTSSTALFNNNDGIDELYYLSSETDKNDIDSMMNPNNYTKTNYDFTNREIVSNHSTICAGNALNCSITGNSILISAIRVSKPIIETYLTNMTSRQTTDFYYYPIEWRITGTAYKSTENADVRFNNAYVKVYLPKYLQKIEYGSDTDIDITREELTTETIGEDEYNVYSYTIDMKNKSNTSLYLPIYTNIYLNTPNNSQPKVYAVIDYDVTNGNNVSNSVSPVISRTTLNNSVTIHNQAEINTQGTTTPTHIEKNGTFTYKMEAYNNSASDFSYDNAALYYVLPYKGDSAYSDLSSKFVSTGYKVKIPTLPAGYKAYYTNGPSSTIISEEINTTSTKTHEWVEWSNPTEEKSNVTAIKIEKNTTFAKNEFFGGNEGISVNVTPIGSGVGDVYYNAFYLIADRPSGYVCVPQDANDPTCDNIRNTRVFYNSNRSSTSVYNRQISGFVWEDYDYSGLLDDGENKLDNIPVSVCKVSDESKNAESYNKLDPNTYVKNTDECLKETITDTTGSFIVNGLTEGDYYVKYTFDNQKYTVTDFQRVSLDGRPSENINSKAFQLPGKNIAVSYVISFTDEDRIYKKDYINLGLKIKKQFAVDINKYITKTELTVNGDTTTTDYNNETKVSLNVKNTNDAHVRVTYSFVIENVKYFPGYVGLISDFIPKGMTFNPNLKENQDWIQVGNVLFYNGLSNRLLLPNEKNYFSLVLDLDIKKGGYYINFVSADDLILMGDEVPNYDFITGGNQSQTGGTENPEQTGTENNGEGN